jgi:hypothetical protein
VREAAHEISYSSRLAVVDAAEEDPNRFGKLVAAMNRNGSPHDCFQRLQIIRQAEAIRKEPPALPGRGPYRVLAADPGWPRQGLPYPIQTITEIKSLPVASIAHVNSVMWLWVTNNFMREAFEVLDAWDFEHRTILTWATVQTFFKDRIHAERPSEPDRPQPPARFRRPGLHRLPRQPGRRRRRPACRHINHQLPCRHHRRCQRPARR